ELDRRALDKVLGEHLPALRASCGVNGSGDSESTQDCYSPTTPKPIPASRRRKNFELGQPDESGAAPLIVRRRGRPPGSGSLAVTEPVLADGMRKLIDADPQLSPTAAATGLAGTAAGGGTLESKARRLAKRYVEKFRRSIVSSD